jgi:ribonuclease Z
MARLLLLGTGAAYSGPDRTTTMIAFEADGSVVVVDCGGDAVQRLLAAGADPGGVDLLILTHAHPDHIGGFPLFMEKIWLAKRHRPLDVCGPAPTLEVARRSFEAYETGGWEGLPEIRWHAVEMREGAEVWRDDRWEITAAPGQHSLPVIGVRVVDVRGGGVAAYSSDTSRSDAIARLAEGADVLVHEATGDFGGHTSLPDAAHVARQAGVGRLVVVHLPPELPEEDLREAQASFPELYVGEDGALYEF